MTAIVGIKDATRVCLYSDRGASDNDTIVSMTAPKIWEVSENIICGYAGSGGLGQMIQYMKWPAFDGDAMEYLRASLAPAIIKTREKMAGKDEEEASLLIGMKVKTPLLFEMDTSDYSVFPFDYTAIGSGGPIALGSLYSTTGSLESRGKKAIMAAIEHSPSCKGPFDSLFL
jgi:20S proteasome alpha/beta subunit